jgi:hypothetical protein
VAGKWVVLKTNPNDASVPVRTHLVRLIRVTDEVDPLIPADITRLEWEEAQATPFEMELETLVVGGNIVPATGGDTVVAFFEVEPDPNALILPAPQPTHAPTTNTYYTENFSSYTVERSALLFTLPGSEERDVVSHGPNLDHATPEVRVMDGTRIAGVWITSSEWEWKRAFLSVNSSFPTDKHFTVDDGAWRRVAYRRVDETGTAQELFTSITRMVVARRWSLVAGEFGEIPTRGMNLRVVYRPTDAETTSQRIH